MQRSWMAALLAIAMLTGCGTKVTQQPDNPSPAKPDAGALLPPPKTGSDAKTFDLAPGGEAAAESSAAVSAAAETKLPDAAPVSGAPASAPKQPAAAQQQQPPAAKPSAPPKAPEPSAPVVPTPTMQEPPKAPASTATPAPTPKPAEQDLLTPPMAGGGGSK